MGLHRESFCRIAICSDTDNSAVGTPLLLAAFWQVGWTSNFVLIDFPLSTTGRFFEGPRFVTGGTYVCPRDKIEIAVTRNP